MTVQTQLGINNIYFYLWGSDRNIANHKKGKCKEYKTDAVPSSCGQKDHSSYIQKSWNKLHLEKLKQLERRKQEIKFRLRTEWEHNSVDGKDNVYLQVHIVN